MCCPGASGQCGLASCVILGLVGQPVSSESVLQCCTAAVRSEGLLNLCPAWCILTDCPVMFERVSWRCSSVQATVHPISNTRPGSFKVWCAPCAGYKHNSNAAWHDAFHLLKLLNATPILCPIMVEPQAASGAATTTEHPSLKANTHWHARLVKSA